NGVALKFERSPAPTLGARILHQVAPGLRVLRPYLGNLIRAIEAHPVAESPAEQIASGRIEDSACQVPESDLNSTGGRDRCTANRTRAGTLHQHLGVEFVDV